MFRPSSRRALQEPEAGGEPAGPAPPGAADPQGASGRPRETPQARHPPLSHAHRGPAPFSVLSALEGAAGADPTQEGQTQSLDIYRGCCPINSTFLFLQVSERQETPRLYTGRRVSPSGA